MLRTYRVTLVGDNFTHVVIAKSKGAAYRAATAGCAANARPLARSIDLVPTAIGARA